MENKDAISSNTPTGRKYNKVYYKSYYDENKTMINARSKALREERKNYLLNNKILLYNDIINEYATQEKEISTC